MSIQVFHKSNNIVHNKANNCGKPVEKRKTFFRHLLNTKVFSVNGCFPLVLGISIFYIYKNRYSHFLWKTFENQFFEWL